MKIGHITCDNASNNNTMMEEFAKRYHQKSGKCLNIKRGHIRWVLISILSYLFYDSIYCRCLAHIINIATQALIATCSKARYYNPHVLNEHEPDANGTDVTDRDEVGLICAIVVKVGLFLSFINRVLLVLLIMIWRNDHHLNVKNYSKLFNGEVALHYLSSSYLTWRFSGVRHMLWSSGP